MMRHTMRHMMCHRTRVICHQFFMRFSTKDGKILPNQTYFTGQRETKILPLSRPIQNKNDFRKRILHTYALMSESLKLYDSPPAPAPALAVRANHIHQEDCLLLMRRMPANSVDMVFADPPFNLKKKYASYKDNLPFRKYMHWTENWIKESLRILKPTGSLFVYNIPRLLTHTAALLDERAHFRHWIAWNSHGRPLGKTMQPAHYGILFYSKSEHVKFYDVRAPHARCRSCKAYLKDYGGKEHLRHQFGYQISDVWNDIHRVRHNVRRIDAHPCQLPVPLIERMILMSTDEGDMVFEPFTGSGTGAVAAKQMGRNYIGAEIDAAYCAAARKKFRAAEPTKIRGHYASLYLKKIVSMRAVDL